ncbi:HD domain-containing phosphohydrolase [Chondromyces apiculatus]|uniref:Diguanylate cyclase and metal dependent phosphohydrolase n=1 Tax=Chondromyces apiculatus DSM 436 TaxID=1192034 RepID=A0A017T402_9BACT|nr:HD domain-containing phosphohydrolase [Chondromyces apiculatus]EYF03301.1 diguanylate cyclase and metal dependent phosphohydrolase [Chondromyces apiculatus DSM 436]
MVAFQGINQRIADRLLLDGRIAHDDYRRAVEHATRNRSRIEDAMIELEILSEADLLKFIATLHNTRFVSSEKLSKAIIDARVLSKVSSVTATLHGVFPVLLDDRTLTLSVATADPDNDAALHEIKLAAGVRDVRAIVARPAAVRAAISYHYRGDTTAFNALLRPVHNYEDFFYKEQRDPFERTQTGVTASFQMPQPQPAPMPVAMTGPAPVQMPTPPPVTSAGITQMPVQQAPTVPPRVLAPATPIPPPPAPPLVSSEPATAPAVMAAPVAAPPPEPPPAPTTSHEYLETLNVLVTLLENNRQDLRGHSSTVARLARKLCERIGLSQGSVAAYVASCYLHDLGKAGPYHLTALNVAEYEGHRLAATKAVELPAQLMESAGVPQEVTTAITHMYERYDGTGFPDGLSGKEIPLGARVLAVVDTYADLSQNPRNPYRKTLRPAEACDVLAQYRGNVFDPNIVDLFRQVMTGDDIKAKLLADRHTALIVDPDPEETTVLELRLIEQGFDVYIARTAAQARREIESREIEIVVSEVDLEEPDAGLAFRSEAIKAGFGRDKAWVILTSKTDRQTAQRAFELGVDDIASKPVTADIFAVRLRQIIERKASNKPGKGVTGSLSEMGLPDMVQILWHGRRTCALKIQTVSGPGEIHFADGQIIHALYSGLQGEDAFYKMLTLHEGDFRLEPNFTPGARTIKVSPEGLLLEGMRRLDEGTIG